MLLHFCVLSKKDIIKERRMEASILFHSECYLCHKKYGKNFQFHHITYRENEKKHSDFDSYYEYTMYVVSIICKRPDDFALLCKTCHYLITILQAIKDNSRFERVVDLARRSRK